jgi:Methyltransferase domain
MDEVAVGLLVSARSLREYRAMFALDDFPSSTSYLDCAAGAASFAAESAREAYAVTATDILFSHPLGEVRRRVLQGVEQTRENIVREPRLYQWRSSGGFFKDPAEHTKERTVSAQKFIQDYTRECERAEGSERYISASLETLPFGDDSFDVALCSHFLFLHSASLSETFQLNSIREMARVSRLEVRIYPIVGFDGDNSRVVKSIWRKLQDEGLSLELRDVEYKFFRNASQMLVIS